MGTLKSRSGGAHSFLLYLKKRMNYKQLLHALFFHKTTIFVSVNHNCICH